MITGDYAKTFCFAQGNKVRGLADIKLHNQWEKDVFAILECYFFHRLCFTKDLQVNNMNLQNIVYMLFKIYQVQICLVFDTKVYQSQLVLQKSFLLFVEHYSKNRSVPETMAQP